MATLKIETNYILTLTRSEIDFLIALSTGTRKEDFNDEAQKEVDKLIRTLKNSWEN